MQASDIPAKVVLPFAADATPGTNIRTVPVTSGDPNAASYTLGFPPNTMIAEGAGGVPPDGRDFNGILFVTSAWNRWQAVGAIAPYDATFQTAIGGYPSGAIVADAVTAGVYWRSTADNNVTDPGAAGAGWVDASINPKARIVTSSATLNLDCGTDFAIGLNRTSAPAATPVNLAATGNLIPGKTFRISDLAKNFSLYPVTVAPPAGHNIAGDSNFVMNEDKQSASFVFYDADTWDVQTS